MIDVKNVCKTFKVTKRNAGMKAAVKTLLHKETECVYALRDISFSVADGEMVGYIGPNGAGKSSTIKIMSGILTPDSGECIIDGLTPWKNRIKHVSNIGVVFGQRSQLWWDVPVIDSFELIRDIYRIPDSSYRKNLSELTELLNLEQIVKTPARQLSLGQRMRCEIAASLLHNPKTLFLDEPTIGLDAVSKIAVREFIKKINQQRKTTVILTTHDMQDIEALTKRILLIGKGQILLDGDLAQIKSKYSDVKTIIVDFVGTMPIMPAGISIKTSIAGHAELLLDSTILSTSDAISFLSSHLDITDFSINGASAEELVVKLYKEFAI